MLTMFSMKNIVLTVSAASVCFAATDASNVTLPAKTTEAQAATDGHITVLDDTGCEYAGVFKEACENAQGGNCQMEGNLKSYGCKLGCGCYFWQSCGTNDFNQNQVETDPDYKKMYVFGQCHIASWVWIVASGLFTCCCGGGAWWKCKNRQ